MVRIIIATHPLEEKFDTTLDYMNVMNKSSWPLINHDLEPYITLYATLDTLYATLGTLYDTLC